MALVLSAAQMAATLFVTVVSWFILPPPLGAITAFLLMVCLLAQTNHNRSGGTNARLDQS